LRAPIAGRVGQRNAEVGMLAGPGDVLFVLGDLSDLIVEVPLTEEMLRSLRVGQRATLRSPSLGGATLAGTLARISPFLEASSFSTLGEIEVEEGGHEALRPGMFVTVEVHYGESREATLVPASALWEDPRTGVRGVFVVTETAGLAPSTPANPPAKATVDEVPQEPRSVKFRPVEVLADGRATVGVGGLEEGDWVVTVGQHLLARDGDTTARVRATTWDRVLELQDLQREDLLQSFLDRQQEWARTRGAEPPTNEEFLRRQGG
jgi:multidrug efflux pump subunit AcrA (membrane-fusion protein)